MGFNLLLRVLVIFLLFPATAFAQAPMRLGVLKFGTVNWELDVIRRHQLDRAEGIRVEWVELATNQATLVALQAGHVNAVVSDWFWVSRQRAEGADWTFIPFSTALGAVIVPAASRVHTLPELAGQRLGIAGSPLDKSWLMLRALARQKYGLDLNEAAKKSFAAPPLLGEQLEAGRLDAVLTYWQFAARLEARGASRLLGMDQVMQELGMTRPIPLIGYVVSERWAREHSDLVRGFVRASARAREILAGSDAEWEAIAPLTGTAGPDELNRLRDAFRAGIPRSWGKDERGDAARLYRLLAEIGGEALVGKSAELHPGTFLDDVGY
jgi:NitT/TauT family transport system substrate-binding protein